MNKKRIFPSTLTTATLNERSKGCVVEHVGIVFTKVTENYIEATMPVDHRTKQPRGILHGGSSVLLSETIGSIAANVILDMKKQFAVGLEINTNHLKSVTEGVVVGKSKAIHIGKSTHVWGIEIRNEKGEMTAISRLTMAILDIKK